MTQNNQIYSISLTNYAYNIHTAKCIAKNMYNHDYFKLRLCGQIKLHIDLFLL